MNNSLGSIYFYTAVLFIIIFMFAITLTNCIYYTDIYNTGSENLSESESQQLMYFNMITCILLFVCLMMVGYMMIDYNKNIDKIKKLDENIIIKREIIEEKEEELDNEIKKIKTKEEMYKIVEMMEVPIKKATSENKKLIHEINELNAKVEDVESKMKQLHDINGKLLEENKSLYETDKDYLLKLELSKTKNKKSSLFGEEIDIQDSAFTKADLFDSFGKDKKMSVSSLFPENASFSDVLKSLPLTSVIETNKDEKDYDYGIEVPRDRTIESKYESYTPGVVKSPVVKGYKPFLRSFLKK